MSRAQGPRASALGVLGALALAACGADLEAVRGAASADGQPIIGGSPSPDGAYPAVVAQLTSGDIYGYPWGGLVCTGTLIAPDVVLTAAHCTEVDALVYGGEGSNIRDHVTFALDVSGFGIESLALPADAIAIRGMQAHPDWDLARVETMVAGLQQLFDIALLFLERAAPRTPAVVLADDDASQLRVGAEVEIVGYGQRDAEDPASVGVQYQARSFINELGTSEMQIGDQPPGDPQKCHGDSGGPTFMSFDDGRQPALRLIGVTSHAYDSTDCHRGGVDTMIPAYRAWIDQAMRQACATGQRVSCANGGGLPEPSGTPWPQDAGSPGVDGGARDAGPVDTTLAPWPDAAAPVDAQATARDARRAPPPIAGMPPPARDAGCGCQAGPGAGALALATPLLPGLVRRRRRLGGPPR